MKHVPLKPPAPPTADKPMSPARYLRLRRLAAGLTVDDVAVMLTERAGSRDQTAECVRLLESDGARALSYRDIARLRRAFPIDPDVYRQLAEEPVDRHPRVCRRCACSEWDPCDHEQHGACHWVEHDLCSHHRDVDHDPDGDADRAAGREHG